MSAAASARPVQGLAGLVVTRPEPEASRWTAALRERGWATHALPLIDIGEPRNQGSLSALQQWRERWPEADAVMFVSGAAVVHFFSGMPAGWLADALARRSTRFWAPGPATAGALRTAGVPNERIDAPPADAPQFDSETLWPVVAPQMKPGATVLIVRGASDGTPAEPLPGNGRDWLIRQCESAGGAVQACVAYERHAPAWGDAQRAQALAVRGPGHAWLFSSSEALVHLQALLPETDWSGTVALATHPRIAETARAAGFTPVITCRPALSDVMRTLESTWSPA